MEGDTIALCKFCKMKLIKATTNTGDTKRKYCNKQCRDKYYNKKWRAPKALEKHCKFCNKIIPKEGLTRSGYLKKLYCGYLCRLRDRQRAVITSTPHTHAFSDKS